MAKKTKSEPALGRVWYCGKKSDPDVSVFIETGAWFDARAVATVLLGGAEVFVVTVPEDHYESKGLPLPRPRVQARWEGYAPDKKLRVREIAKDGKIGKWRNLT